MKLHKDIFLSWTSRHSLGTAIIQTVWTILRLNSGNFGNFYPDQFHSKFSSRVKSALKIIPNDTDTTYDLLNFRIENSLFIFCVGETVRGKSPNVSRVFLRSKILISWVPLTAVIWFQPKNRPKNGFHGGWNCVG